MDLRITIINAVSDSVRALLDDEQLQAVQNALTLQLNSYEIQVRTTEITAIDTTPDSILLKFIATKRVEGKSEETLRRYRDVCYMMIHTLCRPLHEITTYDLRYYLAEYKRQRHVSNRTLDGIRRCFSSFFNWLQRAGLVVIHAQLLHKSNILRLLKNHIPPLKWSVLSKLVHRFVILL